MFNSRSGKGLTNKSSNNFHVLDCNNGSPPVMRSIVRDFETSGYQRHHALT
jgi:hypothetical protein